MDKKSSELFLKILASVLREHELGEVQLELQAVTNRPIVDEKKDPERDNEYVIYEREPDEIEKAEAALSFLRARLYEAPALIAKLEKAHGRDAKDFRWVVDDESLKTEDFSGSRLSVSDRELEEQRKILVELRQKLNSDSEPTEE